MVPLVDVSHPAAECGGYVQSNSTLFVSTFATLETVVVLDRNPEPDPRGEEKSFLRKIGEKYRHLTD